MITRGRCALVALILAAAMASGSGHVFAQTTPPAAAPAGNAENGQKLFTKYGCYECHGREGQGAPGTGPRLGPSPLPMAGFLRAVRAPRDQMPPYTAKVVTDQELTDIRAFLTMRPAPASVQVAFPPE